MKKFLKQMTAFFNEEEKNSLKYEQFKKDNESLVNSFNAVIHSHASPDERTHEFLFKSLSARVKNHSKKSSSFEISCPFFKNNEEIGRANIIFVTTAPVKIIEKLHEHKTRILGIYFEDDHIGCMYETKKGHVDYFYEKALLDVVSLKDVTVDLSHLNI